MECTEHYVRSCLSCTFGEVLRSTSRFVSLRGVLVATDTMTPALEQGHLP